MKLRDAIRIAEKLVDSGELETADAVVAVHCLVQMSKKVLRLQKPLRQLERALCPKEELNQQSLFSDDEEGHLDRD